MKKVKSNLKEILAEKGMSIRQLSERTSIPFETLRRLHNNMTIQYHRDTIAKVCDELNIEIHELLKLVDDSDEDNK